jgi:hypothetical protein
MEFIKDDNGTVIGVKMDQMSISIDHDKDALLEVADDVTSTQRFVDPEQMIVFLSSALEILKKHTNPEQNEEIDVHCRHIHHGLHCTAECSEIIVRLFGKSLCEHHFKNSYLVALKKNNPTAAETMKNQFNNEKHKRKSVLSVIDDQCNDPDGTIRMNLLTLLEQKKKMRLAESRKRQRTTSIFKLPPWLEIKK